MKNNLMKSISLIILVFCFIPVFSQDALIVFFNDGNFRKFNLNDIVEISTSKYDDKGVAHSTYQFQHIVTKDDKYVYDLNNINFIAFSKYEEEKAEQNFVKAMPEVANELSECENIHDAENQLNQIKGKDGVEDAWSDGHKLYVKIDEGETFSFHFNHGAQVEVSETRSVDYVGLARSFISSAKRTGVTNNEGIKVVVANQQYHDEERSETRRDFIEPLVDAFINCGIHADYVTNPTVDFFYDNSNDPNHLHIYDYDIILLITHGAYLQPRYLASNSSFLSGFYEEVAQYDQKCHAILADADWELANIPMKGEYNNKWKECYSNFKTWKKNSKYQNISDLDICFEFMEETRGGEKRWIGYPVLTEHFFRNTATGRFHDNSILFNVACQSLLGDNGPDYPSYSFANTLFAKNLSLYAGYTETNILGGGFMPQFLDNMLKGGKSIGAVYSDPNLPEYFKVETRENIINSTKLSDKRKQEYLDDDPQGARILFLPESDAHRRFLFNVYTSEVDQNAASKEYKSDNTVTVSCTLTVSEPSNVSAGFEYGTDKNNLSQIKQCESYRNIENKGKGNYCFNAKLTDLHTDLERGNTYYYRAYTFDGWNYNYGNTCSFYLEKINDLELSSGSFCINQGESTTITITTGNGDYDIHNSNDKVATVSVDGEILKIDAVGAGTTTITVTDKKTNQQVSIDVTVWANLSIAIIGNIDLEVGASANVKITSGNNDYTIESSNSTVAIASIVGEFIKVQALSAGKATITITDNKTEQKASFNVTATEEEVADLQVSAQELTLEVGEKASLTITAGSGSYEAKSNNDAVATVSVNGNEVTVIGISTGTAIITVTDTKTGQTALIEVIVVSSGETPDNSVINFADSEVKAICIKNWDTNGDGELSKSEAAAVKDLKRAFRKNSTIINFDELQYFIGLTSIGSYAFSECRGLTSVTIPNTVTCIESHAFAMCNLTSITIPNSVTSIESYVFSNNYQLSSVKIPSSVTSLTYSAFAYCTRLTSIDVEEGNLNYTSENGILFDKSKTTIICYPIGKTETSYFIPNSVTKIERMTFCSCSTLTSITIPNSVTIIGEMAFDNCSALTSITIPDAVKTIERATFSGCSSLTSVNIPTSTTYIALSAFYGCKSLTSITIPNSVLSIGDNAFQGCKSLTSVIIGNNVTTIGGTTFSGCESLVSITIPSSVKRIGYGAFGYCSSLTEVHSLIEEPFAIVSVFDYDPLETLYVPKGTKAKYEAIDGWNVFKNIVEM